MTLYSSGVFSNLYINTSLPALPIPKPDNFADNQREYSNESHMVAQVSYPQQLCTMLQEDGYSESTLQYE